MKNGAHAPEENERQRHHAVQLDRFVAEKIRNVFFYWVRCHRRRRRRRSCRFRRFRKFQFENVGDLFRQK